MEVILRDDVPNLGRVGEIVKVKDGYARNYLIPQGLAYAATPGNKRRIESEAKHRSIRLAEQKSDAEATAAQLAGGALAFTAKAGEGDKLFGSITSADIAKQLAQNVAKCFYGLVHPCARGVGNTGLVVDYARDSLV